MFLFGLTHTLLLYSLGVVSSFPPNQENFLGLERTSITVDVQ